MKGFTKFSLIYSASYSLVLLIPAIIVTPVDYIFESFTGVRYVDGWTKGFMAYYLSIFAIPIAYAVILGIYCFAKSKRKQTLNPKPR